MPPRKRSKSKQPKTLAQLRKEQEQGKRVFDWQSIYGANIGDFNPATIPRKGTKVRRMFDEFGLSSYEDVLLESRRWRANRRNPKYDRAHAYRTIDEAIRNYIIEAPHLFPFVSFYRDRRGLWHAYIEVDSP